MEDEKLVATEVELYNSVAVFLVENDDNQCHVKTEEHFDFDECAGVNYSTNENVSIQKQKRAFSSVENSTEEIPFHDHSSCDVADHQNLPNDDSSIQPGEKSQSIQKDSLEQHSLTYYDERKVRNKLSKNNSQKESPLTFGILSDTEEKQLLCEFCSYKTNASCNLQKHYIVHIEAYPFSCELCSYKSKRKTGLKQHILTHSGKKKYSCDLCNYKSAKKSHIERHISCHTGEKPFSCKFCPYKSNQKENLKSHNLIHDQMKSFSCKLCPFKSNRKSCMKKHEYKHH